MISFFFENIEQIPIPAETSLWLADLLKSEDKKEGTINYIFCDDEHLLHINQKFLGHDYYTDIITFDYVKGKTVSADIFVSLPRIFDNSERQKSNFDSELHRVLAHGLLHLCGYKDKTDDEGAEMRKKEDFYLSQR